MLSPRIYNPKMCSDHYELLVITLSRIVKSRWVWYHSTQLDELFRMNYQLHIRIFHPENELTPLFSFSTFRDLISAQNCVPKEILMSFDSTSSFEWHINCPDWNLGPINKFYRNLLLTIMSCNSNQHFFRGLVLVSFAQLNELFRMTYKLSGLESGTYEQVFPWAVTRLKIFSAD